MEDNQLRQHYAGIAMNGILSSPRWSSILLDMQEGEGPVDERAKNVIEVLTNLAWNLANSMVIEGRERGFVGASPGFATEEELADIFGSTESADKGGDIEEITERTSSQWSRMTPRDARVSRQPRASVHHLRPDSAGRKPSGGARD